MLETLVPKEDLQVRNMQAEPVASQRMSASSPKQKSQFVTVFETKQNNFADSNNTLSNKSSIEGDRDRDGSQYILEFGGALIAIKLRIVVQAFPDESNYLRRTRKFRMATRT